MRLHETALIVLVGFVWAPLGLAHRMQQPVPTARVGAESIPAIPHGLPEDRGNHEGPASENLEDGGDGLIRPVIAPRRGPETEPGPGFQWEPAIKQGSLFLAIMHGFRLATEPGTREELRGPFLRDYVASIKGLRGWGDGDPFIVNYVGHPFQGAVSGYIQIQNDPRFRRLEFSSARPYWTSRLRAMAFAAAFSTQFELGPVSEAAIGNVGKDRRTAGAVDLVVTPLGGLGIMLAEDFLDRFLVRRIEKWTTRPLLRALARGALNPNRSFANLMRFRTLWHRDTRPGVLEP